MKKILILDGSMRKLGNTSSLVESFIKGAEENNAQVDHLIAKDLHIEYCNGCLRCNLIKRCSISGDDWAEVQKKIQESDVLVVASPIYFHYVTAPLKKIIDRLRSIVHVQITETGVLHTPYTKWEKDIVLLLSMGSSDSIDAQPVVDLFEYMKKILGENNRLHVLKATRLGVIKQITKSAEELKELYPKLMLNPELAESDFNRNRKFLEDSFNLGKQLS